MTNRILTLALILALGVGVAGCNTVSKFRPPNDEVLTMPLPYDLTYLRTMETLDAVDHWQLEETDKELGLIKVRDTNFSSLDDADLRVVTFRIKRVDRGTTSVSIDPSSQKVYGGEDLLKAVRAAFAHELNP